MRLCNYRLMNAIAFLIKMLVECKYYILLHVYVSIIYSLFISKQYNFSVLKGIKINVLTLVYLHVLVINLDELANDTYIEDNIRVCNIILTKVCK